MRDLLKNNHDLDKIKLENHELIAIIHKTRAERDLKKFINLFINKILQNKDKRIDELSEITQNFYQDFAKQMENNSDYTGNLRKKGFDETYVVSKHIFYYY